MSTPLLAKLEFASFPVLLPGTAATRTVFVDADAPAKMAMTDFRLAPMVTTGCDALINDALRQMTQCGTRFAFVVGPDRELLGSITSYDIQGEKPVQYLTTIGCAQSVRAWRDVQVQNIMEPVANWRVLDYAQVARMCVADVATLLADSCQRYLVVVECASDPRARQVRGLFSAARLHTLMGRDGWSPTLSRGMTSLMMRASAASEPATTRYA